MQLITFHVLNQLKKTQQNNRSEISKQRQVIIYIYIKVSIYLYSYDNMWQTIDMQEMQSKFKKSLTVKYL